MDIAAEPDVSQLRRKLERLRAENVRLSRLLDLRGQDTAPAPEQLAAAAAAPDWVTMLALFANLFPGAV